MTQAISDYMAWIDRMTTAQFIQYCALMSGGILLILFGCLMLYYVIIAVTRELQRR